MQNETRVVALLCWHQSASLKAPFACLPIICSVLLLFFPFNIEILCCLFPKGKSVNSIWNENPVKLARVRYAYDKKERRRNSLCAPVGFHLTERDERWITIRSVGRAVVPRHLKIVLHVVAVACITFFATWLLQFEILELSNINTRRGKEKVSLSLNWISQSSHEKRENKSLNWKLNNNNRVYTHHEGSHWTLNKRRRKEERRK